MSMQNIVVNSAKTSTGRVFVRFYINGKRYRYFNGRSIDRDIFPNKEKCKKAKKNQLNILNSAFELALFEGWLPQDKEEAVQIFKVEIHDVLKSSYELYLESKSSDLYKRDLKWAMNLFLKHLNTLSKKVTTIDELSSETIVEFFNSYSWSSRTKRNVRSSLVVLFGNLFKDHGLQNPFTELVFEKGTPTLHKPFRDVNSLLEDIKSFNENLFLCCLFTYGCLLRPHQEIRNLKWGDFSEDMKHISLSGKRNKSGRNRIVPLNPYILQYLKKGLDTYNIFTGTEKPFNSDYFKTLWSRYKAQSNVLEDLQTLYSFRHSGAIEIYKRTSSLTILQQAMGHASLAVTLGYLRGLEIPSLKIEDMPRL
jgi:integrase